jgi:hypothetical protein
MAKIYLLVKEFYGDFDIHQEQVIGANESSVFIDTMVNLYNNTRTNEELRQEVSYSKKYVPIIGE